MFQFPGFASSPYGFRCRYRKCGGFPHSEIHGSKGARPSPQLIAACHVLHRLSVPRHPPDALKTLDLSLASQGAARRSSSPQHVQRQPQRKTLLTGSSPRRSIRNRPAKPKGTASPRRPERRPCGPPSHLPVLLRNRRVPIRTIRYSPLHHVKETCLQTLTRGSTETSSRSGAGRDAPDPKVGWKSRSSRLSMMPCNAREARPGGSP